MEQVRSNGEDPKRALLEAAEVCLRRDGLAGISTRRVAEQAGMPLSQIHYHFRSKQGLLLALLEHKNQALLERQTRMFAQPMPLWRRWLQACDYLDEDLDSGYVRVLQEMIAAGWSDPRIATEVRRILRAWYDLLTGVAREATERLGALGPFEPAELAALAGNWFMGTEAMILLGFDEDQEPARGALRKVGALLKQLETTPKEGGNHASTGAGS